MIAIIYQKSEKVVLELSVTMNYNVIKEVVY